MVGRKCWMQVVLLCAVVSVLTIHSAAQRDSHWDPLPPVVTASVPRQTSPTVARHQMLLAASVQGASLAEAQERFISAGARTLESIEAFLASGKDEPRSEPFKLGAGGALLSASSARVFFIDLLPQFDTQRAYATSRALFPKAQSAEEAVLLLRNIIWGYPDRDPRSSPEVHAKIRSLLQNAQWKSSAAPGYLEAFDLVVYAADSSLVELLVEEAFSDESPGAVRNAGTLALLRLAATSRALLYRTLLSGKFRGISIPTLRPALFAYADVQVDEERSLLLEYLMQRASVTEYEAFVHLFPLAVEPRGNYLLTEASSPSHAERALRDRASLEFLSSIAAIAPGSLAPAMTRLSLQLESAVRGGLL